MYDSSKFLLKYRQPKPNSVARKKTSTKHSSDIYGNKLTCSKICHDFSMQYKEFTLTKEAFNFRRWSFFMIVFSSLAFYSEFYNTDLNSLGIIFILLGFILLLKLHLKVKEESLLIIASLGLQLTTTFVSGRKESQFIFLDNIHDVIINEGISMHRVLYYLAILLKDTTETVGVKRVIPLFQNTLPRLDCLENIYQGLQVMLFIKS